MDLLDLLRRQAGRFHCPNCGETMVDCRLELVARTDAESLVKVICAHCQDARVIAVQVQIPEETVPHVSVRDEPPRSHPGISTDEILDVRLAMRQHEGDLESLLAPPTTS